MERAKGVTFELYRSEVQWRGLGGLISGGHVTEAVDDTDATGVEKRRSG